MDIQKVNSELAQIILKDIAVYNLYTRKSIERLSRCMYNEEVGTDEFVRVIKRGMCLINSYIDNLRNGVVLSYNEQDVKSAALFILHFYKGVILAHKEIQIKWHDKNNRVIQNGDICKDINHNTGTVYFWNNEAVIIIEDEMFPLYEMPHCFDGRKRILQGFEVV